MNRITALLEYLLVFLIILDFNTPYLIYEPIKRIVTYSPILILLCLVLIHDKKMKGKDFVYVSIYWSGALIPLFALSKDAYFPYFVRYILLLPLLWMYLKTKKRMGITDFHSLFIRYSNVVVVIAVLSVTMWFLCSVLQVVPRTMMIPSTWTMDGGLTFIPTYYGIYFETQMFSFWGIECWRNSGIFQEGPMYNMVLCIALMIECFIRRQKSKIRICVLVLSVILTVTTTGQIFLFLLGSYFIYRKIGRKHRTLSFIITPVLLFLVYWSANTVITEKRESKSGDKSMEIRSNSIQMSLKAGLERPFLGWGLMRGKVRVGNQIHSEHSNSLADLFAYGGLYVWALYVGILFVVPLLYYRKNKDLEWLLVMMLFFLLFSVTYSIYRFLTFLFIAWGLSNIDMRRPKQIVEGRHRIIK